MAGPSALLYRAEVGTLTLGEDHARTKNSLASARGRAPALDWDNQPLPFKVYADLNAMPLPTDLPGSQRPALATLSGAATTPQPLNLSLLPHLLSFSAGE